MTARDIQRCLIRERYRRSFVIPNYTPRGWFECDIFECTKAGFFREFEIKLTRSDFKTDAKKSRRHYDAQWQATHNKKHDLLYQRDVRGPKQFYYVTPVGLLAHEEIPDWAGLIELHDADGRLYEQQPVMAPILHRQRADPKLKAHAESICYWRFHNVFLNGKIKIDGDP